MLEWEVSHAPSGKQQGSMPMAKIGNVTAAWSKATKVQPTQ
jgi:hypothetical protein